MASTIKQVVSGTALYKYQEPTIWVFQSVAGMRAFPGPRRYTAEGDCALAFTIAFDSRSCFPTITLWAWNDECAEADNGTSIIMPTDHPVYPAGHESEGDPVPGRWVCGDLTCDQGEQ